MGFVAPALPWIAKGAGALFGGLAAKKAQSSAMKRSPEEQAALAGMNTAASGLTDQAGTLARTGTELATSGAAKTQQAGGYYQTLLRGNRSAMAQAVAAPTAAITETYRGAERGLEKAGVRGAAKDQATADLGRQRASQIAGLTTGVQPAAAEALAGLGGQQTSQGIGAQTAAGGLRTAAGGIYGNLLTSGNANRIYGRQEGAQFGSQMGGLIFDLINGLGKKGGGYNGPIYGPGY